MRALSIKMDTLLELLTIPDEGILKKYCQRLTITNNKLGEWIASAPNNEYCYQYKRYSTERMPDHLNPTPKQMTSFIEQISSLKQGEVKTLEGLALKVASKVQQLSKERRARIGHLFHSHDMKVWCLIYMTQRDTQVFEQHWKYGPHVHLFTSATVDSSPETITNKLANEEKMPDGIHVRFFDPEWGQEWHEKWAPDVRP